MIRKFFAWITLRDYDSAMRSSAVQVVARYSRGNVSMQNGWVLDEARLGQLSRKADLAVAHLRKIIPA